MINERKCSQKWKNVKDGLQKSIGASNYNAQNILIIFSIYEIKPAINEVEFYPSLSKRIKRIL